jgi:hypothetical protein
MTTPLIGARLYGLCYLAPVEREEGTSVAPHPGLVRRAAAMIAMLILVGLALAMMWRVYLHHERSIAVPDEPALVRYVPAAT